MNYQKLTNYILWALLLIGVLVAILFFGMGNEAEGYEVAGDVLDVPVGTNLMIVWNYILLALAILATLGFVIAGFVNMYKQNAKHASFVLGVVIAFVLLFVICWFLGSPEKLNIIGYDGTDNQGFWARLSDMMMYATYVLVLDTVGTLIWGVCYTLKLKK